MRYACLLAFSMVLSASAQEVQQNPCAADATPVLHASSQLVVQDLSFQGSPPATIGPSDLRVMEDGVPQQILALEPLTAHSGTATPEVSKVIFLFDQLNTTLPDQMRALSTMKAVLKTLQQDHTPAIYRLSGSLQRVADFDEEPAKAQHAVNGLLPAIPLGVKRSEEAAPFAASQENMQALPVRTQQAVVGGRADEERLLSERNRRAGTLQALALLALELKHLPERKSLLWLTDGIPFGPQPGELPDYAADDRLRSQYEIVLRMLASSQVSLFPIDLRGLPISPASLLTLHGEITDGAHLTGGQAFFNNNDLRGQMQQAMTAPANTYRLTYRSTNEKYDGSFRAISLTTPLPHIQIISRAGYYAAAPRGDAEQLQGIVQLAARPESPEMKELKPTVSLEPHLARVHISVPELVAFPSTQEDVACYAVAVFATHQGKDGKPNTQIPVRSLSFAGSRTGANRSEEVEVPLPAKPGRYNMRFGLVDLHNFYAGTVSMEVRVPKP